MSAVKSLRDLIPGDWTRIESNTLEMVASEVVVPGVEEDPLASFFASMPGDDVKSHPMHSDNPFAGENVLVIARALREGFIPAHLERQARVYIDRYQKLTGEAVYSASHHVPVCPVEQQYADDHTVSGPMGLRAADPYGRK